MYGEDTPELLRRIQTFEGGKLNLCGLKITGIPELPKNVVHLDCSETKVTALPKLPEGLEYLYCSGTPLESLPELPKTLKRIWCHHTKISAIPELPKGFELLWCPRTPVSELPEIPEGVVGLEFNNTLIPFPPFNYDLDTGISMKQFIQSFRLFQRGLEAEKRERAQKRCKVIKEELMAELWHPRRVGAMLEESGWDMVA